MVYFFAILISEDDIDDPYHVQPAGSKFQGNNFFGSKDLSVKSVKFNILKYSHYMVGYSIYMYGPCKVTNFKLTVGASVLTL